jgi:ABC-type glycerol-3-phosphate transport system permease component
MIALPLSLDGLIVTAIIIFASCWNEALFAAAVTSQHAVTIPVLMLAVTDRN